MQKRMLPTKPAGKKPPPKKRAARGTLNRELVLAAALRLADREGVQGLTIRELAGELGVTPMAVYRHFAGKEAIVGSFLDYIIACHDVTGHGHADWRKWILTTFRRIHAALLPHPAVLPILGTAASQGPAALRVFEESVTVLERGGYSEKAARRVFFALISYTVGAVAIEGGAVRAGASAEVRQFWEKQFVFGLESLLAGMER